MVGLSNIIFIHDKRELMKEYKCKWCDAPIQQVRPQGNPRRYCDSSCKDKWRHFNSDARKKYNKERKKRLTESGHWKKKYREDREYQKARALKYYYDNRDAILEQKRNHKGRAQEVAAAIAKIRCGLATEDDAWEWMESNLGFHSLEVESFVVEVIEDE